MNNKLHGFVIACGYNNNYIFNLFPNGNLSKGNPWTN